MVAAHVGINPSGQNLLLRNTTWLPAIPGLGALATMIFAPQVEFIILGDLAHCEYFEHGCIILGGIAN